MSPRTLSLAVVVAIALASSIASAHEGLPHEIAELTERIVDEPSNPDLLLERADLWRIEDDYARARADLRRARELGADPQKTSLLKGRVLLEAGDYLGAKVALDAHLKAQPDSFYGRWYRARVRGVMGDVSGALEDYDQAVKLGGKVDVFVERGRLLEAREDWKRAAANYRLALSKLGEHDSARAALWRVEMKRGKFEATALAVDPILKHAHVRTS